MLINKYIGGLESILRELVAYTETDR